MDTVDRIIELSKEQKITQQVIAAAIGVKEDTVSNWFRRKAASYTKYIPQIAEVLDTTTEYLLTGEGPKHKGEGRVYTPKEIVAFMALLERFKLLSADAQKEVAAFIDFKLSQEGKSQQIDPASGSSAFLMRAQDYLQNIDGTEVESFGIEAVPMEKSK